MKQYLIAGIGLVLICTLPFAAAEEVVSFMIHTAFIIVGIIIFIPVCKMLAKAIGQWADE